MMYFALKMNQYQSHGVLFDMCTARKHLRTIEGNWVGGRASGDVRVKEVAGWLAAYVSV